MTRHLSAVFFATLLAACGADDQDSSTAGELDAGADQDVDNDTDAESGDTGPPSDAETLDVTETNDAGGDADSVEDAEESRDASHPDTSTDDANTSDIEVPLPDADGGLEHDTTTELPDPAPGHVYIGVGNWGQRGMTCDGVNWNDVSGEIQDDDHTPDLLRDVAYGDGLFVAVGGDANSMIMTSTDGVTWSEDLYPEGTQWLGGVAWGDGVWIAAGGWGAMLRSADGVDWTPIEVELDGAIRDMGYGDGRFVAVGDSGRVMVSRDGLEWTTQHVDAAQFSHVGYGHGTWVATGTSWSEATGLVPYCFLSDDALAWSRCPFLGGDASSVGSVVFGDGQLVVTAGWEGLYVLDSPEGEWSHIEGNAPESLTYANGMWVGDSWERRHTSTDLRNWTDANDFPQMRAWAAGYLEGARCPE